MAMFVPNPGDPVGVNDPFGAVVAPHPLTGRVPALSIDGALVSVASWSPGSITSGGSATKTVTIAGGRVGDKVEVAYSPLVPGGLTAFGYVSVDGTVTLQMNNTLGSAIDPGALTATVSVLPQGQVVRNDGSA